jgi:hypothetical protein
VSFWSEVFLGVIACATLAMALMQIGVLLAAGLLLRRIGRLVEHIERDVKPIFAQLDGIARDAARAVTLATAQVERADRLFTDVSERVDQILTTVQRFLRILPAAGGGRAVLSGLLAALGVLRDRRHRRSRKTGGDDEDALFI